MEFDNLLTNEQEDSLSKFKENVVFGQDQLNEPNVKPNSVILFETKYSNDLEMAQSQIVKRVSVLKDLYEVKDPIYCFIILHKAPDLVQNKIKELEDIKKENDIQLFVLNVKTEFLNVTFPLILGDGKTHTENLINLSSGMDIIERSLTDKNEQLSNEIASLKTEVKAKTKKIDDIGNDLKALIALLKMNNNKNDINSPNTLVENINIDNNVLENFNNNQDPSSNKNQKTPSHDDVKKNEDSNEIKSTSNSENIISNLNQNSDETSIENKMIQYKK